MKQVLFLNNCNVNNVMNPSIDEAEPQPQRMTSLEIAELTGKQHKNLMRDIRNMEPAWEKLTGLKFELCQKTYQLANGVKKQQPYYSLTKRETLYIATKYNDEARDMGIQYRRGGHWNISDDLEGRDLVRFRTHVSYSLKGEKKIRTYMTWTLSGLRYLNSKLGYPNF